MVCPSLSKDRIGRRQGIQLGHVDAEVLRRPPSGDGGVGLGIVSLEM